jgi:hypothetical protein
MQQIVIKNWNGFPIEFEEIDGQLMANATAMCAAYNKKPSEWLRLPTSERYIKALEAKWENPIALINTRLGGLGGGGGTWIHEKLILKLAQWLSIDFELQCDEWLAELLRTGKVELAKPKPLTQLETLKVMIDNAVLLEQRQTIIELELEEVKVEVKELGHTIVNQVHELNYFTVAGYHAKKGKKAPHNNKLKELGKRLSKLSRERAVKIAKAPHEKFGEVNVYRDDILSQVLGF